MKPDKILILSAKHGLLRLDTYIEPYDITLNSMTAEEVKAWASKVLAGLKKEINLKKDKVIFLAGIRYRKYLVPAIKNYKIPLKGLAIGKQLKFLKANT